MWRGVFLALAGLVIDSERGRKLHIADKAVGLQTVTSPSLVRGLGCHDVQPNV